MNRHLRTKRAAGSKVNWIKSAINPKHVGALHKELGVRPSQKIPVVKLNKAANLGGVIGRRARLAKTLRKINTGRSDVAVPARMG